MDIGIRAGQLKTVLLLGGLTALVVGAGSFAAPSYAWAFAIAGVAMNIGMWFFSDRMVLRTSGARLLEPAESPDLHEMVRELAAGAGIATPKLYLIEADYANAFATGRNPAHGAVAVTTGLLRVLSRREVRGVVAHEIAHIRNRDVTIATVAAGLAAVISGIANALQFSAFFGGSSDDEEAAASASAGCCSRSSRRLPRAWCSWRSPARGSTVADATAARLTGDPEALATALERLAFAADHLRRRSSRPRASLYIVNPLTGGGLASMFSTHPPMEEANRPPARAAGGRTPGGVTWTCSSRSPAYWWVYAAFTAGVLAVLAVDLGVFHRQAHAVTFRESLAWSAVWVALALAVNYGFYCYALAQFGGEVAARVGLEFLTGYLVEKALAVDNVFVFVLVFGYFGVPPRYQHRVLFYGILGALVFRAAVRRVGRGPDALPRRRRRLRRHPADLGREDAVRARPAAPIRPATR